MTGHEIREAFLRFFEGHGHRRVRSSSLVPANDPTLLFTNAGMNQFKDVFLGLEQREYRRATTCQKCVRAGGKHNDLEMVGFTNRHHTFFEMLGNFSFGDYFKKEAIAFAWDLVTSPQWFAIPKDKLYVTVFKGEEGIERDHEAYDHWLSQGVAKERIYEFGSSENFWAMGETGPCGPCSEIHCDMGRAASDSAHANCEFGCDCGRYVEIWNLVFMQFNRDSSGQLNPLPKPSVDTGAGLERLAAVLQDKISNFDTDLFRGLISEAGRLTRLTYGSRPESDASLRIIADHSRATTLLISDGVIPANEGRGYVLKKIMRRAILHGRLWGTTEPFLHHMVHAVTSEMGGAYPDLSENEEKIAQVVLAEERRFSHTIAVGLRELEERVEDLRKLRADEIEKFLDQKRAAGAAKLDRELTKYRAEHILAARSDEELKAGIEYIFGPDYASTIFVDLRKILKQRSVFPGAEAFKLYDTFGLPRDFIEDAVRDRGMTLDSAGFDEAMEQQRARARASWKGGSKEAASPVYARLAETFQTELDFYYGTTAQDCHIEAIVTKEGQVNELAPGAEGEVVLDRTAVYAESGGQVADTGSFYDNDLALEVAQVRGAYYPVTGLIAHRVVAKEKLQVGDRVATVADALRRARDKRNHTATHLVHAALRNILGTHVKQAGSLVAPDHLRFDFSHFAAVDPSELKDIEEQVNEEILRNTEIATDLMNIDDALASGALAFFGDKYPSQNVRVVTILDPNSPHGFYSKELCGGTHVSRTGEIGVFKILSEQSTAAGIRRVEAITGDRALSEYQHALDILRSLAAHLNTGEDELLAAVERQAQAVKQLEKQLEGFKRKAASSIVDTLLEGTRTVKDVRVVAARVAGLDREAMRQLVDVLRQKLGSGVVVLFTGDDGKVSVITGVTKDLTSRLHAGKIVQELARQVGGSGGGRPDLAEAGGKDTSAIEKAIDQVVPLVERLL
jgi:alanyl-tRNA synthetase